MTYEDAANLALARASLLGARSYTGPRSLVWRRIAQAERALFAAAAHVNPDFYGVAADGVLAASAISLADIATPVPDPQMLQRIEVLNAGGSAWAVGTEIALVTVADADAEVAPRMTLRNGILRGYGADLTDVVSIKVYYSSLPAAASSTEDGTRVVAVPDPYDELVVLDAGRFIASLDPGWGTNADATAGLAQLTSEETRVRQQYLAYVEERGPVRSRFVRPPAAPQA